MVPGPGLNAGPDPDPGLSGEPFGCALLGRSADCRAFWAAFLFGRGAPIGDSSRPSRLVFRSLFSSEEELFKSAVTAPLPVDATWADAPSRMSRKNITCDRPNEKQHRCRSNFTGASPIAQRSGSDPPLGKGRCSDLRAASTSGTKMTGFTLTSPLMGRTKKLSGAWNSRHAC